MKRKLTVLFTFCIVLVMLSNVALAATIESPLLLEPGKIKVKVTINEIALKDEQGSYVPIFVGNQIVDLAAVRGLTSNKSIAAGNYTAIRITQSKNVSYYFSNVNDAAGQGPWYSKAVGNGGSVTASQTGPAVEVISPITGPVSDVTIDGTTIHVVMDGDNITYESPLSAPIVVSANAASNVNLRFVMNNMLFVEGTPNNPEDGGTVSSIPPLLRN